MSKITSRIIYNYCVSMPTVTWCRIFFNPVYDSYKIILGKELCTFNLIQEYYALKIKYHRTSVYNLCHLHYDVFGCCLISVVDCGPLSNPEKGLVDTSSGTTYNSVAFYTCIEGYVLVGESERRCGSDGLWTPTAPSCVRKSLYTMDIVCQ